MIRRVLSLLLIPLLLANQGRCYGHVHCDDDFAHSERHASRPHYHLGDNGHFLGIGQAVGHEDHAHSHAKSMGTDTGRAFQAVFDADTASGDRLMIASLDGEHDSNAVYCIEPSIGTRVENLKRAAAAQRHNLLALSQLTMTRAWSLGRGSAEIQLAFDWDATCPIYLRTCSLRI